LVICCLFVMEDVDFWSVLVCPGSSRESVSGFSKSLELVPGMI
jgi:hypothetical protein